MFRWAKSSLLPTHSGHTTGSFNFLRQGSPSVRETENTVSSSSSYDSKEARKAWQKIDTNQNTGIRRTEEVELRYSDQASGQADSVKYDLLKPNSYF